MAREYPNIILLIMDSARKDMFGCYGSDERLTPNIDRFARRGMLLKDHYAPACGSAPSHVSIFTGQHPARHRMFHNLSEMKSDLVPFPVLLKRLGYLCVGHCKASFIPPCGFEEMFGFDELSYPGKEGFARTEGLRNRVISKIKANHVLFKFVKKTAGRLISRERQFELKASYVDGRTSLEFLTERLRRHKGDKPVFAYTTLLHPHTPYCPPKPFRDRVFRGETPDPRCFDIQDHLHAYMNGDFGEAREAMESVRRCYQADLLYGDHLVGGFLDRLEDDGTLENSIVIVTSDHGEMLGEYGMINHGFNVWELLFATPCILFHPEKTPAGTTVDRLTSGLDLVPTIFDLIGEADLLKASTQLDGASVLSGDSDPDGRALVVDSPPVVLPERLKKYPNVLFETSKISRAVRTKEYKYVWRSNGEQHLYPAGCPEEEAVDLISERREVAEALHRRMVAFYNSIESGYKIDEYRIKLSPEIGRKHTDPAVRQELERLGYL